MNILEIILIPIYDKVDVQLNLQSGCPVNPKSVCPFKNSPNQSLARAKPRRGYAT